MILKKLSSLVIRVNCAKNWWTGKQSAFKPVPKLSIKEGVLLNILFLFSMMYDSPLY